jgi:hypothetical protein
LLGAALDSPVESSEYLMIIFYDILLLDDIVCSLETYNERRRLLQSLVRRIPGRTDIGYREVIEFSSFDAAEWLSETFSRAIEPSHNGGKDLCPKVATTPTSHSTEAGHSLSSRKIAQRCLEIPDNREKEEKS